MKDYFHFVQSLPGHLFQNRLTCTGTVIAVLLLAMVLRFSLLSIGISRNKDFPWHPDSYGYVNIASNMLKHHAFANGKYPMLEPETFRTPGYPLLIAVIYGIFGESYIWILVIQILVATSTVYFAYLIGKIIANHRVGIIASIIVAIDFPSVYYSITILSEALFTLFLTVFLYANLRMYRRYRVKWLAIALAALVSAIMVRPVAYYMCILVPTFWIISQRFNHTFRKGLIWSGSLILVATVVVGGWQLRNYIRTGNAEFSSVAGGNLFMYRAAGVLAEIEEKPIEEIQTRLRQEAIAAGAVTQSERSAYGTPRAIRIITRHPWVYAKVHIKGMLRMFAGYGVANLLKLGVPKKIVVAIGIVYLSLFWLLFFVGCIYAWMQVRDEHKRGDSVLHNYWLGLLIVVYMFLVSGGPEVYSRFRVPIVPMIAVFIGTGVYGLWKCTQSLTKVDVA